MDHQIWSLTSAQWALCCPYLMTTALWHSPLRKPARPSPTTRHGSTLGPTHWAPCWCRPAPTAGWWTSARVPPSRSVFATPLWSEKATGTRPVWATTVNPGCCPTTTAPTPSFTTGKACPCRWWRDPRGSGCCWTGWVRRWCFTNRTPVLCCTQSCIPSVPRCLPHVRWLTAVSLYCTDRPGTLTKTRSHLKHVKNNARRERLKKKKIIIIWSAVQNPPALCN